MLPSAAAAASGPEPDGVPSSSLVFHLDASLPGDSPTSIWADRSGNGNNGATTGTGVSYVAASGSEPAHYSLGGATTVSIPVAGGAMLVGNFVVPPVANTKMIWFRRDATDAYHNLISTAADGAPHFFWFREPSYLRPTAGHDSTAGAQQATFEVGSGVWTFGAVTFSSSSGLRILTNSSDRSWSDPDVSEDAGFPAYTADPSDGVTFRIGGSGASADNRLEGDVATAVVHSRALTVSEVRAYYAATVDRFHPV